MNMNVLTPRLCPSCSAGLTETDLEAERCTQCDQKLPHAKIATTVKEIRQAYDRADFPALKTLGRRLRRLSVLLTPAGIERHQKERGAGNA